MAKNNPTPKPEAAPLLVAPETYVVYCEGSGVLWKNGLGEVFHTSNELLAQAQAYEVTRASLYSYKAITLKEWASVRLNQTQSS